MPSIAAVSVLIVLASGDLTDEATRAMQAALRTVLGAGASVTTRLAEGGETDRTWKDSGVQSRAALVAVVAWSERPPRVLIHFTQATSTAWSDREIRFADADGVSERGRTVGFALASMVPFEPPLRGEDPVAPTPVSVRTREPSMSTASKELDVPRAPPSQRGVEVSGVLSAAVAGAGGGAGAAVALRLSWAGPWAVRAVVAVRAGDVAAAQATTRVAVGGAGVAFQPWLDARRTWAVGGRVDGLALYQSVTHFSADDPEPVTRAQVLPAFDVAVEGTWRWMDRGALVCAFGTEVALGHTAIVVKGREVGALSAVRVFGEVGFRLLF
jgi:hypothetical protein